MELLVELIETGIGSGLCWLFQNLTSWPELEIMLWLFLRYKLSDIMVPGPPPF